MPALATQRPARRGSLSRRTEIAAALVSPLLGAARARAKRAEHKSAEQKSAKKLRATKTRRGGGTSSDQSPHREYYARACHATPCPPGQPV